MKFLAGMFVLVGLFATSEAQENMSTEGTPSAIGIHVGQKAPVFAGQDQFGHEQSNKTLKGTKGTVLLFFRSADW